jgi:DNA-binding response OmpR family regulator
MVVDDDVRVRTTIAAVLTREGYEVCQAADGLEADQRVGDFLPDVVILDIVMPRLSGSELLKRWRARNLDIGVIVLTAYGDEESATASLEAGADDHIAKPFRLREFVARVAAVLRRTRGQRLGGTEVTVGPVRLDLAAQTVTVDDRTISLTPMELSLLRMLMGAPGRVFSANELLTRIWGPEYRDDFAVLRTTIYRVRRKLHDPRFIQARPHAGYVFSADASDLEAGTASA